MNVDRWYWLVFSIAVIFGLFMLAVVPIPKHEWLAFLAAAGLFVTVILMLEVFFQVVPTVVALWIVSVQVGGMIKGKASTVQAISDALSGDKPSDVSMLPDVFLIATRTVVGWKFFHSLILALVLLGISWGVSLYTDYRDKKQQELASQSAQGITQ